jgi:hypothetical protein
MMSLLACGIPLSLLMDLAVPGGPCSSEIYQCERPALRRSFPEGVAGVSVGSSRLQE